MKPSRILFFLFLVTPIISQSQILSNNLSQDSIEINWDIENHEFNDALLYVARNNSKFDKTVTLSIKTKWKSTNKLFSVSLLRFDIPKGKVVSNIMDEPKVMGIQDSQYLEANNLQLEVSIKSVAIKDLKADKE